MYSDFKFSGSAFPVPENGILDSRFNDIIPIDTTGDDLFFDPLDERETWMKRSGKGERNEKLAVNRKCTDPNCIDSQVYYDEQRGETICLHCGTVISHHAVDSRGIRVYTQTDIEKKSHNEPMKAGIRPELKFHSSSKEEKRLERLNNRVEWEYKKVMMVKYELSKLKSFIHIPSDVEELTMKEVEKMFKTDILKGRYALATGIAIFYWACLKLSAPIDLSDILKCYEHDRAFIKQIRSSVKTIQVETEKKFIPKKDYSRYITRMCSDLSVPQSVCTTTINWIRKMQENKIVISGNPGGFIGGCLLEACKKTMGRSLDTKEMQQRIASSIKMTEVTVKRRAREVRKYLDQILD